MGLIKTNIETGAECATADTVASLATQFGGLLEFKKLRGHVCTYEITIEQARLSAFAEKAQQAGITVCPS